MDTLAQSGRPRSITFLAGGPGESATGMASEGFIVHHPLRTHRDIVLVDQRGTGHSHDLRCQFYGPSSNAQDYFGPFIPADKAPACGRGTVAGLDTSCAATMTRSGFALR